MYIRLFIFFMILWMAMGVSAQRVLISPQHSLHSIDAYGIIGNIDDRSYSYVREGGDVRIYAYDDNMRLVWDRELKLFGGKRSISGVFKCSEGIEVVYSYIEDKKRNIIADRFGLNAERSDSVYIARNIDRTMGGEFNYVLSEDEKQLLIYYLDKNKIMKSFMFDRNRDTTLWNAVHEYQDLRFSDDLHEILVSNYGEAFIIFNEDNDRYKRKDHQLVIATVRSTGEMLSLNNIPIDSLVHVSSEYHWDEIQRKIRTVHLVHEKSNTEVDAVSTYLINPFSLDDIDHHYFMFSKELLEEYYRVESPKKREIDNLDILDLIPRADGGFVVLSESSREVFRANYNVASRDYLGNGGNIDYFYEDIVALACGPKGYLDWSHVLRKKQYSYGDDGAYSSYGTLLTPSRIRLLFNDEIKKENTVSEYVLNGKGMLRRFSVMNTQYKDLGLRFRDAFQTGPLTMIVPSEVGNDLQFVKFIFN